MKLIIFIFFLILTLHARAENPHSFLRSEQELQTTKSSIDYFGYFSSTVPDIKTGNPSVFSYHLFAFNFWQNSKFTFSLRPSFTIETQGQKYGTNANQESSFSDTQIAFIHKDPFGTEGEISSKLAYKIYLPTDPDWKATGISGALGVECEISKEFSNGVGIAYLPRGYYLLRTADNAQDLTQKKGHFEHWITTSMFLNKSNWLTQGFGFREVFAKKNFQLGLLETTITFEVNAAIHLSLGISQEHDQSKLNYEIYENSETSYFLMTSFKI
jgi:hypothetical protein